MRALVVLRERLQALGVLAVAERLAVNVGSSLLDVFALSKRPQAIVARRLTVAELGRRGVTDRQICDLFGIGPGQLHGIRMRVNPRAGRPHRIADALRETRARVESQLTTRM